jgi:CRP-like cAMP-binding protein
MKQLGLKYFTNLGVSRYLKVALLKAGKSFGEVALTTSAPRSAAIIANENLVLLSLTKEGFNSH